MTANHTLILRFNSLEYVVLDKRFISVNKRLKIWVLSSVYQRGVLTKCSRMLLWLYKLALVTRFNSCPPLRVQQYDRRSKRPES